MFDVVKCRPEKPAIGKEGRLMDIGAKLKGLRQRRGLTQEELADRCELSNLTGRAQPRLPVHRDADRPSGMPGRDPARLLQR